MQITVLVENATSGDRFEARHGLSLWIETDQHKILFDMGPDGSFIDNARALGIDVAEADVAFCSHGHFDHGGGLPAYLALGGEAPVYIHERAFDPHEAHTPTGATKDIGIDPALADHPRVHLVGDHLRIDDQLELFADVAACELVPRSNCTLYAGTGADAAPDDFCHEQTLLIKEGDATTLVTGCSHKGVVNIVRRAEEYVGGPLHAVVAGFHLMNPGTGSLEDLATVEAVAEFLAARPTLYRTFHCTGLAAYGILRDVLGPRVDYLYTGSSMEL